MQSLLGGADCSAGANPLGQMMKREGVDRGLYRDRLSSHGESSSSNTRPASQASAPFRATSSSPFIPQLQQLQPQRSSSASPHAQPVQHQHQRPAAPAPQAQSGWSQDYSSNQQNVRPASIAGAPDFRAMEEAFRRTTMAMSPGPASAQVVSRAPVHANGWLNEYTPASMEGKGKGRAMDMSHQPQSMAQQNPNQYQYQPQQSAFQSYQPSYSQFQPQYSSHLPSHLPQPQNKQTPAQIIPLPASALAMTDEELDLAFEQAMRDEQAGLGAGEASEADRMMREREEEGFVGDGIQENVESTGAGGDFEAVWQSLRPDAERLGKLAEWEKEFSQFTSGAQEEDFDALDTAGMFGEGFDGAVPSYPERMTSVGEDGYPILGDYEFEQNNPHSAESNTLQQALDLLQSGGSLTEACLLLEATLSSGTADQQASAPSETSSTARLPGGEAAVWVLLGQTQAMDEKETAAVRALEEGRRRFEAQSEGARGDQARRTMGEGLVSLAISYTNESYDHSALLALHRYLSLQYPSYAGQVPQPGPDIVDENGSIPNPWSANQALTDSYLNLARDQHNTGNVDADVQVGLGVLYYQTGEFERARDCWVAALGVRPNDYQLWNRLGATLANSGHPEEAVDAYRRALELKPTFTRAIYNMGVSCLNIGVYQEAAEHLLAGLALHQTNSAGQGGPNSSSEASSAAANHSSTLWSTLRRTFVAMDRHDLAEQAQPGANLQTFRQAGFEF